VGSSGLALTPLGMDVMHERFTSACVCVRACVCLSIATRTAGATATVRNILRIL
jgi:hypothetical protein